MIWKSNVSYCTLFCPKYCAPRGAVPTAARTTAATTVPIRFTSILSLLHWPPRSHRGRIAPQPLELIERPQLRMKNMYHEVYVIEQHPAALRQSFHVMRGH